MLCTPLYYSGDEIMKKIAGEFGMHGRQMYTEGFGGETWCKELLGKPGRRWEDDIKMDFKEVELGGMDWIDLAQDRDRWRIPVNAVIYHRVT